MEYFDEVRDNRKKAKAVRIAKTMISSAKIPFTRARMPSSVSK